jgi:co-chaperonin GroES (HSP10)
MTDKYTPINFYPITSKVIVERLEKEEPEAGKIILTEETKKQEVAGIVVAVGPGEWLDLPHVKTPIRRPMQCGIGNKIFFGPYAGTEIDLPGYEDRDLVSMWERDIIGIMAE